MPTKPSTYCIPGPTTGKKGATWPLPGQQKQGNSHEPGPKRRPSGLTILLISITSNSVLFAADPPKAPGWVKVTDKAAWKARDSQGEVVFKDKLWLMGGWYDSFSSPPRDVWSSSDGKTWELVQPTAPWKHSDLPMTTVFDGKMWLMGGWYNGRLPGHSASSEVWSSADGVNWEQATKKAGWSSRLAAGAVVFKDNI